MSIKELLSNGCFGMNMGHFEEDPNLGRPNNFGVPTYLSQQIEVTDNSGDPIPGSTRNFITEMGKFQVIRFMEWQKTNVSKDWAEPAGTLDEYLERENRPSWQWWDSSVGWKGFFGVPLRECLKFAKACRAHPWICIPHGKSLADFQEIMNYIVDTVDSFQQTQDIYRAPIFEFSNEIWNKGSFAQQRECAIMALGGNMPANDSEQLLEALRWQAERTVDIANYVNGRGAVVIGGQAANSWIAGRLLSHTGVADAIDAIAIAPYFGQTGSQFSNGNTFHPLVNSETGQQIDPTSVNAVAELQANLNRFIDGFHLAGAGWIEGVVVRGIRQHLELCMLASPNPSKKLIQLWGYEGGQHLEYLPSAYGDFNEDEVKELYLAFNRSQSIVQQLNKVLWHWSNNRTLPDEQGARKMVVGGLYCAYSSTSIFYDTWTQKPKNRFFGHIELANQVGTSPNYLALPKFMGMVARADQCTQATFRKAVELPADGEAELHDWTEVSLTSVVDSGRTLPSILDLEEMPAGTQFTYIWQIKNINEFVWGDGYSLQYKGEIIVERELIELQDVADSDVTGMVTIYLSVEAPTEAGEYAGIWRLINPDGDETDISHKLTLIVIESDIAGERSDEKSWG